MPTSEGLKKGARAIGHGALGPRTKQNSQLGRKTRVGNPKQQGLRPLGKSVVGISLTHLEVKVNPR